MPKTRVTEKLERLEQLEKDYEILRTRNAELEEMFEARPEESMDDIEPENGIAVESMQSAASIDRDDSALNELRTLKDAVTALVNTQRTIMEMMQTRDSRKRKIYVDKPDKFEGKVGDYIETQLEQFQTWFKHREQMEGKVDERHQVETAMQTTAGDISHQLTRYEADYGRWETWDAFAQHMRDTYGSKEPDLSSTCVSSSHNRRMILWMLITHASVASSNVRNVG